MNSPLKLMTHALCTLSASAACAGGIERMPFTTNLLFEEGRVVQFELGGFHPDISGAHNDTLGPIAGIRSGNMSAGFGNWSIGAKLPLSERADAMLTYTQPYGADVSYPAGATGYMLSGSTARLESKALTGVLRYKVTPSLSALAGLRIEQMTGQADIAISGLSTTTYALDASNETDTGYILGVAWEKPEIGARVVLTYLSEIKHDMAARETLNGAIFNDTRWTTEVPKSVLLEAQTGIAKDTLLFGSIRWTEWSKFSIEPSLYFATVGGGRANFVDPISDTVAYTLGLGHRFSETWSGAVIAGYEPSNGGFYGNLGPVDGYRSLGVALTWTQDDLSATLGLRYVEIGDASTRISEFTDNSGWGGGLRIGYRF